MRPHILIAGIGNIFPGDDGFGVAVAQRLERRALPDGVIVKDYGIRGFDLAYAMMGDYDATILIDAMPRGGKPGTLYTVDATHNEFQAEARSEINTMNPFKVLQLVQMIGGQPRRVFVVGCEPASVGDKIGGQRGLSPSVENTLDEAVTLVESLVQKLVIAEPVISA